MQRRPRPRRRIRYREQARLTGQRRLRVQAGCTLRGRFRVARDTRAIWDRERHVAGEIGCTGEGGSAGGGGELPG